MFLSLVMVISVFPMSVFAWEFIDMPNNWSRVALEKAIAKGLLKGDNGKIRPEDSLTRAEMATILNRSFQSKKTASLKAFKDVAPGDWYYEEMGKAVEMKIFKGTGDKLNPNKNITRQEAFLVLARAFKISELKKGILSKFSDKNEISTWAKDGVSALVSAGYIAGSNGKINPKQNITRAEFAQIMDNLLKTYITKEGQYTEDYKGNVMINKAGVTLKGSTLEGDLIIGDGVGDGEITLDGVTIKGRIVVRGGGENSIKIIGNSNVKNIIIGRVDGKVRIYSQDGVEIGEVTIDGNDDVILEGEFDLVTIVSEDIKVVARNANIEFLTCQGSNTTINVDKNSTIDNVVANGEETLIEGDGKVKKVVANGDNIAIKTKGTQVEAGENSEGVTAGDKKVDPGKTETSETEPEEEKEEDKEEKEGEEVGEKEEEDENDGDETGGPPEEDTSVLVDIITVSAEGNLTQITENGGSLQLNASVEPRDADNTSITWSLAPSNIANINETGLLTALDNGTVTVRATANDGSGVVGTLEIIISGQVDPAVTINIPRISGVTAPVTGATPVDTITETDQYTGSVTWTPAHDTFAAGTKYTAEIVLTPKSTYTLSGVAENFFTVEGANATNAANTGVVKAVFSIIDYYEAGDSDFSGEEDGSFKYIGSAEYVIIPDRIKGIDITSYKNMFAGTSVKGIKSSNSNISNMSYMFYNSSASSLDLSDLYTSNVVNMEYMFKGSKAATLDLSDFSTSNVTNMTRMFSVSEATTLDLSSFDTSSVTDMEAMFSSSQATTLDLSSFDTSNVTNMVYIFSGSQATTGYARTQTDVDKFNGTPQKPEGLTFELKATIDVDLTLTSPLADENNTITVGGGTKTGNVNVVYGTKSVVITGSKTADQTIVIGGDDSDNVIVSENDLAPTYTVDTSDISSSGGSKTFTLTVSEEDKKDIIYSIKVIVVTLKDLTVDGMRLEDFNFDKFNYTVKLASESTIIPTVKAIVTDVENIDVTITDADSLPGTTTILVEPSGGTAQTYEINFEKIIGISTIEGVTAPVIGQTPVESITETDQYTGTISWTPAHSRFAENTVYTVTISLTEKPGYSLTGVAENFFTVEEATATNPANAGVVTAVFPKTDYHLAGDSDFSGEEDGSFKYIGSADYVEIPHIIKGINITSYESMFRGNSVKGVKSDNENIYNMANMFRGSQATTLDLSSFETSGVTDMKSMFQSSKAISLDLSGFDTSKVTDMSNMFYDSQANTLDLSSFDTSKVTDMHSIFSYSEATTLDLSSFDTSKVTNMRGMFYESQASTLDLSSFDTSNVTNTTNMFEDSHATTGYARTQADADKFNTSSGKPAGLTFILKE